MPNFIDLTEAKTYLQISSTEFDTRLSNLITMACSVIESYCGRTFSSNTYTEYHDGGKSSVYIRNFPINSVSEVWEYDGTQYKLLTGPLSDGSQPNVAANANSTPQYMWYSETGEITRDMVEGDAFLSVIQKQRFFNRPKAVKVVYNGGYDIPPADLKQATLDYLKIIYKDIQAKQVSLGGETIDNYQVANSGMPVHIQRTLNLYRNPLW